MTELLELKVTEVSAGLLDIFEEVKTNFPEAYCGSKVLISTLRTWLLRGRRLGTEKVCFDLSQRTGIDIIRKVNIVLSSIAKKHFSEVWRNVLSVLAIEAYLENAFGDVFFFPDIPDRAASTLEKIKAVDNWNLLFPFVRNNRNLWSKVIQLKHSTILA